MFGNAQTLNLHVKVVPFWTVGFHHRTARDASMFSFGLRGLNDQSLDDLSHQEQARCGLVRPVCTIKSIALSVTKIWETVWVVITTERLWLFV